MISPLRRCPSQDSTVALVDEVCVQENSSGNSGPVHDIFVHSWWVITKSFFDDVKRELECPFCQKQFNETRELKILNDLYTFCKSSLEDLLHQQARGKLSCVTCRQITGCRDKNSLERNCFPRRNSSTDNREWQLPKGSDAFINLYQDLYPKMQREKLN